MTARLCGLGPRFAGRLRSQDWVSIPPEIRDRDRDERRDSRRIPADDLALSQTRPVYACESYVSQVAAISSTNGGGNMSSLVAWHRGVSYRCWHRRSGQSWASPI